jgi:hypothetical protein
MVIPSSGPGHDEGRPGSRAREFMGRPSGVELLSRYSNREDLLKPLVNALDRINSKPEPDEPQDQLPSADGPTPTTWRVSDRLSAADVKVLVQSYLAGDTIRVLAERYSISITSVKRLLREHGARKLPPRSTAR